MAEGVLVLRFVSRMLKRRKLNIEEERKKTEERRLLYQGMLDVMMIERKSERPSEK